MVLLKFTNVVVDQFPHGKGTENKFVYFLTHWHSDHYYGISNTWKRGPIYCSHITRNLMLCKYPKLEPLITGLDLDTPQTIKLSPGLSMEVRLFDSNHIAGSVMILFEGYFGRVLHSGDMRFHSQMFSKCPYLFPLAKTQSGQISLPVDQLILDNTYCDPIFKFPLRSLAIELVTKIIDKNSNKRVFLATDSIGKEEVFICLSKYYNTKILLNAQRYNYIKCMNVDLDMFTRKDQGCWIEVIKKHQKQQKLTQHPKSICITLTGWANIQTYYEYNPREYIVPYSLHSNFVELDCFVKAIQPASLKAIVRSKHQKSERIYNIKGFQSYMATGLHLHQRGMEFFLKEYVKEGNSSQEHLKLLTDLQKQKFITSQFDLEEPNKEIEF